VHQLFIDFKKAYDSVRREVLYNILIEFCIPMQLARLIKLWGSYTSSKTQAGGLTHVGCPRLLIQYIRIKNYINICVSNFIITVWGSQFNYSPRGPRNLARSLCTASNVSKICVIFTQSDLVSNMYIH